MYLIDSNSEGPEVPYQFWCTHNLTSLLGPTNTKIECTLFLCTQCFWECSKHYYLYIHIYFYIYKPRQTEDSSSNANEGAFNEDEDNVILFSVSMMDATQAILQLKGQCWWLRRVCQQSNGVGLQEARHKTRTALNMIWNSRTPRHSNN